MKVPELPISFTARVVGKDLKPRLMDNYGTFLDDYDNQELMMSLEYIVKAANLFPELIGVLEGLVKMLDAEGHAFRPRIEAARELLKRAKP